MLHVVDARALATERAARGSGETMQDKGVIMRRPLERTDSHILSTQDYSVPNLFIPEFVDLQSNQFIMPPHRALQIVEVVREICLYFNAPVSFFRNVLMCLALVNKTFSQIALDLLWEELDDVVYAFRLFTAFEGIPARKHFKAFSAGAYSRGSPLHYHLSATSIPLQEWIRFRSYALRVRTLRLDFGLSPTPGAAVLAHLTRLNPYRTLLFPGLRSVNWIRSSILDSSIKYVVCPGLRCIDFSASRVLHDCFRSNIIRCEDDIHHKVSLQIISSVTAASLQRIAIHYISHPSAYPPTLWSCNLRSVNLDCPHVGVDIINALRSLERLETLELMADHITGEVTHSFGFCALRTLSLGRNLQLVTDILPSIQSPVLHQFETQVNEGTLEKWHECLSIVSSQFSSSLRSISIHVYTGDSENTQNLIFAELMEPIYSIHGLEVLSLEVSGCDRRHLKERDFSRMARSWSNLRTCNTLFDSRWACDPHSPPVLHPRVMAEFLQLCPKLETLVVPKVDMSPDALTTLPPFKSSALYWLDFGYCKSTAVPHPDFLARYIDSMAPNLDLGYMLGSIVNDESVEDDASSGEGGDSDNEGSADADDGDDAGSVSEDGTGVDDQENPLNILSRHEDPPRTKDEYSSTPARSAVPTWHDTIRLMYDIRRQRWAPRG